MTEYDDMNEMDDFEVLRAELIRSTGAQLAALITMNVDQPVTVAAALATIDADFEPDAAHEILVATLTSTARMLHEILPVIDHLGLPLSQNLELIAAGEEPEPWDGDLRTLKAALRPRRPLGDRRRNRGRK